MRCYFHLINSHDKILDDEGIEVSDPKEAKAQAMQAIDDLRNEAIEVGASWQGWQLEIVDPSGRALACLPLEPTLH